MEIIDLRLLEEELKLKSSITLEEEKEISYAVNTLVKLMLKSNDDGVIINESLTSAPVRCSTCGRPF